MNEVYRSVWNEALGAWVAVCELAKGRSRSDRRPARRAARRALRLAGGLAAAIQLIPVVHADDYFPTDTATLTQAVSTANTVGDPDAWIHLSQDITTPGGTVFEVATNPLILSNPSDVMFVTSTFSLNLAGPGTFWNTGIYGTINVRGLPGFNALTLSNGAGFQVNNFLSFQSGGLLITGTDSNLTVAGDLAVGRGGDVSFALTGGATVSTNRTFLGEGTGSTQAANISMLVDGTNTIWDAGTFFAAGGATNNVQVTISGGGMLRVANPDSENAVGRSGAATMLVTDPGSRLVIGDDGFFTIGSSTSQGQGNGTLIVRNGGLVSSPSVLLGYLDAGASGTLVVDSGGTLETGALARDAGSASVSFDNGTLRATADNTAWISNFVPGTFVIGAGGLFVDTNTFDVTAASVISGVGPLTKQGDGTLTLAASNTYLGATTVSQGTLLAGIANAFSAASAHTVAAGATLDTGGLDQTIASLDNSGTVSLVGSAPGSTLTVNGNYAGHNGLLKLGTALGDSSSLSDRLVLNGPGVIASGNTSVQITNLGGLGALTTGNGIEVIGATNGATTTAQTTKDAFSLAGVHVDAGAFQYRLFAADASGAGENWYLRSTVPVVPPPTGVGGVGGGTGGDGTGGGTGAGGGTGGAPALMVPAYRTEVSLLAALPEQLRQSSLAMLGNLHQRVGDDDVSGNGGNMSADAGGRRQAWGRVISMDRTIDQAGTVSPRSEGRLTGFQAGTDLWADANWRTGVYVGQLDGDMGVNGFASGIQGLAVGRNDLRSQYFGLYGTYHRENGFYADAVLQAGRHRYDASPTGGFAIDGNKGRSLLASIEVGQAFRIAPNWRIEPQLQLVHQSLDLDDAAIPGALVQQDSHNGWIARAGVRLEGEIGTGAGRLQPYARFNLYRSSSGADVTRFVGPAGFTDIATTTGGTSSELAAGATLRLSPSTSLYGEVGKLWASGGSARTRSGVNGSLGVKVRW